MNRTYVTFSLALLLSLSLSSLQAMEKGEELKSDENSKNVFWLAIYNEKAKLLEKLKNKYGGDVGKYKEKQTEKLKKENKGRNKSRIKKETEAFFLQQNPILDLYESIQAIEEKFEASASFFSVREEPKQLFVRLITAGNVPYSEIQKYCKQISYVSQCFDGSKEIKEFLSENRGKWERKSSREYGLFGKRLRKNAEVLWFFDEKDSGA